MPQIEIELYLNFYMKVIPDFTTEELAFIRSNISIAKLKKKQVYTQEHDIQKSLGYLSSGLMRSYFIDVNGKEVNNAFFAENEFAVDYLAFIKQQKTRYTFECLEDCCLISIPYETVRTAFSRYKNFANFGRKMAEWALQVRTDKYESFLFASAEEKYQWFLHENKSISTRLSLTHIASYLGIERQSLSRIRARVLSQK